MTNEEKQLIIETLEKHKIPVSEEKIQKIYQNWQIAIKKRKTIENNYLEKLIEFDEKEKLEKNMHWKDWIINGEYKGHEKCYCSEKTNHHSK